jgi:hypothetical protein
MEREPVNQPIIEKIPKPVEKDEDWEDDSDKISCDKGNHKLRSLGNDPRPNGHIKHAEDEA